MVLSPGKCCYTSFGSNPDKSDLILEDSTKIPSAEEYVILGVTIDNRLTFYNHLKNLCKKNCKQTKRTDKNCSISES